MSREPGSQITRRPGGSELDRVSSVPLFNRTVGSGASPRVGDGAVEPRVVKAVPGSGVTVQYVDRYIYVDGSMTTATVFEMFFSWGDVGIQQIFSLTAGAVIAEVNLWMLETFDGVGPVITVGKAGDVDDLMNTTEVDPSLLSSFATRPGKEYSAGEGVNFYMSPGAGATKGRGVLSVYII